MAPLLPSVRDLYVSSQHLALSMPEMISGLMTGTIQWGYVNRQWRAVYA